MQNNVPRIKISVGRLFRTRQIIFGNNMNTIEMHLKGFLIKNLQKPYICGRGVYNRWGDGAYHVDTLGPMVCIIGLGAVPPSAVFCSFLQIRPFNFVLPSDLVQKWSPIVFMLLSNIIKLVPK